MARIAALRGISPLVITAALGSMSVAAAEPAERPAAASPGQPSFRSGVAVVPLAVTVERADGSSVAGVEVGAFTVDDEGIPLTIALFYAGGTPVERRRHPHDRHDGTV
jgi:hypothetical protein